MDKSHRYRRPHHKPKHKSVDGFISPERFKSSGTIGFRDNKKPADDIKDESNPKLDDFKRADGYQPTNAPVDADHSSEPLLPEGPRKPLNTDKKRGLNKPPKRRRFFHKPKSWKRFFLKSALACFLLVLVVGGYMGWKIYSTQKKVFSGGAQKAAAVCDGDIPLSELKKEGDARVNILLVGTGGPGHDGPDLTDTVIIASIDTLNDKIDLLSIPRDLWVQTAGGGATKLNAVYPFAKQASTATKDSEKVRVGLAALDKKITQITSIDIHYNAVVNFKAFKDAVNAVGGVTVNVPEALYDPTIAWENKYNPIIASKGTQQFDGAKALLYAKSRETSSDFARGERQRLLLVALKDKVLSLGTYSNPIKVSNLLNSFGDNVHTDLDLASVKCLYKQVSQIQSSNIKSLDMVKPPNDLLTTGNIGGLSTVFPKAGVFDYAAIQEFARTSMRDSALAKENAKVLVLNGTNFVGLGSKQVEILKSYGYNVDKSADAPTKNYQETVLIDLKNGTNKYTKNYLQRRLGVKTTEKLPDNSINAGTADFVIILGTDAFDKLQN